MSRKNDHHDLKESYCLLYSKDVASTPGRGLGITGERKEIAEERDSQAPSQERLSKDYQAARWKINISLADILWPSCVSGLVTSRFLFGNELCLLLGILAEEREDVFDDELHLAAHVEPWKQCTRSSVLTSGRCSLYCGGGAV